MDTTQGWWLYDWKIPIRQAIESVAGPALTPLALGA